MNEDFHKRVKKRLAKMGYQGNSERSSSGKFYTQIDPMHKLAALFNRFTHAEIMECALILPSSLIEKKDRAQLSKDLNDVYQNCISKYVVEKEDIVWTLLPKERINILQNLKANAQLLDWLNAVGPGIGYTELNYRNALLEGKISLEEFNISELQESSDLLGDLKTLRKNLQCQKKIIGWIDEVHDMRKSDIELESKLSFLDLVSPFLFLSEDFEGRKKELRVLREYVNYLASESWFESLSRGITQTAISLSLKEVPALMIQGLGGIGKSTLVGKFILDHLANDRNNERESLRFSYFDFDKGNISLIEPLDLFAEVAKQLSLQFLDLSGEWINLNSTISREISEISKSYTSKERKIKIHQANISDEYIQNSMIDKFRELWIKSTNNNNPPLLLVLDSFEEVQRLGDQVLIDFFSFFGKWLAQVPHIRLVIVGRALVNLDEEILATQNLILEGFDEESAYAYLKKKGIENKEVLDFIINNFGTHPLTLELAIEVIGKTNQDIDSLRGLHSRSFFSTKFDHAKIQKLLFERNLDHIQNHNVRKIAFPGMVVRELSPEIIQHVLAGPCNLGTIDKNQAQIIYDDLLKEKFLIEDFNAGAVRFRKDLRQLVLDSVVKQNPGKSEIIRRKAASYFADKSDMNSKCDYIYYSLMLGNEPNSIENLLEPDMLQELSTCLDELPTKSYLFLARYFDLPIPNAVLRAADLVDWEKEMISEIRNAMRDNGTVLMLKHIQKKLSARKNRSNESNLYLWEAQVYYRLNEIKLCKRALKESKYMPSIIKQNDWESLSWQVEFYEYTQQYKTSFDLSMKLLKSIQIDLSNTEATIEMMEAAVRLLYRIGEDGSERPRLLLKVIADNIESNENFIKFRSNNSKLIRTIFEPLAMIFKESEQFKSESFFHEFKSISRIIKSGHVDDRNLSERGVNYWNKFEFKQNAKKINAKLDQRYKLNEMSLAFFDKSWVKIEKAADLKVQQFMFLLRLERDGLLERALEYLELNDR